MAAGQTEPSEYDSCSTDFPTSVAKNEHSLLFLTEAEAIDVTKCAEAAAAVGIMRSDNIASTESQLLQSDEKKEPGDSVTAFASGSICASDDGDSRTLGSICKNAPAVSERRDDFQGNPSILTSHDPDGVQMDAGKQGSTTMAYNQVSEGEHISRENSVERGDAVTLASREDRAEIGDEVTFASREDSEGVVRSMGSGLHVNQKLTLMGTVVSNQAEAFDMDVSNKSEGGKFVDSTHHGLEESPVVDDTYDMDFDIFDEEPCMFPPLDAEKTEPWRAIVVDDATMEHTAAPLQISHTPKDIDREVLPKEVNKESDAVHEVNNNAARNEDWLHDSQQKQGTKITPMDSHIVKESRELSNMHIQNDEEEAGPCFCDADVVQDEKLACKSPRVENASDIQTQGVAYDGFASLEDKNADSSIDAGNGETKRSDEKADFKITSKEEFESGSVITMHGDAAIDLHELAQQMPRDLCVNNFASSDLQAASEDAGHDTEPAGLLEDPRLVGSTVVEGIANQVAGDSNVKSEDNDCLDLANKIESPDVKYSGSNTIDEFVDQTNAPAICCSSAPCTDIYLGVVDGTAAGNVLDDAMVRCHTDEESTGAQVEVKDKSSCQGIENLNLAKKGDCVVVMSNVSNSVDQLVDKSASSVSEQCSSVRCADSSALALSYVAEPEQPSEDFKQKESFLFTDCREMPLEALSELSARNETGILEQNAMPEDLAVHNNKLQNSDGVLSETMCMKPLVENQGNEPVVMDRELNPTIVSGGIVLVVVGKDEETEICKIENDDTEVIKATCPEVKIFSIENQQDELMCVDDHVDNVKEPSLNELIEVHVKEDERGEDNVLEAVVELFNEEACRKRSETSEQVDDNVAKEVHHIELKEVHVKDAETGKDKVFEATGKITNKEACWGVSRDGGIAGVCHSNVDAVPDIRDGIIEDEGPVTEQETDASNKVQQDQFIMRPSLTLFSEANRVVEAKNLESPGQASPHLPSSPYLETDVKSWSDLVESEKLSGRFSGMKQSAVLVEPTGAGRRASVCAPSKKQAKRLKTDDNDGNPELSRTPDLSTAEEAHNGIHAEDHVTAKGHSGQTNISSRKVLMTTNQGLAFSIGDLVWAKVKSHPWWPAQIFDPADASKSARKAKTAGRVLVAFFGDCTFAWLQQSQMISFLPNFKEKSQQTTMRIFCLAVEEALEELCRRSELGMSCEHFKGSLHSTSSFPDANSGIREGVRIERLKDIRSSADMFRPGKTLDFVKSVAAAPLGEWSSSLEWAESRGYAYGLRTCMVATQGSESALVFSMTPAAPCGDLKQKKSHSSLAEAISDAEGDGKKLRKRRKKKSDEDQESESKDTLAGAVSRGQGKNVSLGNGSQMKSGVRDSADIKEKNKPKNIIKIKLSKMSNSGPVASSARGIDARLAEEANEEQNLDDEKERLLSRVGHSAKVFKRSSSKKNRIPTSKDKVQDETVEELQNDTTTCQTVKANPKEGSLGVGVEGSVTKKTDVDDPFIVPRSPSLRDGIRKLEGLNTSVEIGLKRQAPMKDSAGKNEIVRKFSRVGDSIRRVANELNGTPVAKVVDDFKHEGLEVKKNIKDSPSEFQTSPVHSKGFSKESSEDVSLAHLRQDLEPLARNAGMRKQSSFKKFAP